MRPSEREENLKALGETPWISRVPASIAEAQQLMQTLPSEMFTVTALGNYVIAEVCSTYAGVQQRWLVVQSESRKQADLKQLDKRIAKAQTKKAKALKDLSCGQMIRFYKNTKISSLVNEAFDSSKTPYFLPLGCLSSYLNE